MKKELLITGLLLSSTCLQAENYRNGSMETQSCCSPCCTPCCTPQPTECVSGVAYTVPFYDLQCDWGVFANVEFLYWYATESHLSYGLESVIQLQDQFGGILVQAPQKYKFIDSKWDPGFRVGLGWNSECDGWDLYLNYSWLRNSVRNKASTPITGMSPGENDRLLTNPWVNGSFINSFSSIAAKWRFQWNSIDLEIGRKYWLSSCFNLRPYGGLRGAWWKTNFQTTSIYEFNDTVFEIDYSDKFQNKTWGVGFLGGLQPTWYFCCNFALYSNFDFALIWGEQEESKKERYVSTGAVVQSTNTDFTNSSSGRFSQMTPIFDLGIGLRWEDTWCCDRYRTTLDLGWEHHIYLDQNERYKTIDQSFTTTTTPVQQKFGSYIGESGNIGFGGLVLRARFDF